MAAAVIYFGGAVLWFATFERAAVRLANGPEQQALFKGLVGLFFVIASTLAISWIVWRELRKQHRIQEELRQSNATLEQRVAERTADLQAVNRELESFCYSVAHDLRSPLRSIHGFTRLLEEELNGALNESAEGYLQRIEAAAGRMQELIDAWLQLSRITQGAFRYDNVDLSALAEGIAQELRQATPARPVKFVASPGLSVRGDPNLLRILLENLLGNAWKFTQKVPEAQIELGVQRRNGEAPVFFVRDNGAGFDMKHAANLFRPFQRLHSSDTFEGTGIGLATCQRVVLRHGGSIWAEARIDQGAMVAFTLPEPAPTANEPNPGSALYNNRKN